MSDPRYQLDERNGKFYRIDNQDGSEVELSAAEVVNFLIANYGRLKDKDSSERLTDKAFYGAIRKAAFDAIMASAMTPDISRTKLHQIFGNDPCVIQAIHTQDASLARLVWFDDEIQSAVNGGCVFSDTENDQPRDPLVPIGVNPANGTEPADILTQNGGNTGSGGSGAHAGNGKGNGNSNGKGGNGSSGGSGGSAMAPGGKPSADSNGEGSNSHPSSTGGDPVILFSGAYLHQVTDLQLAGRGLSLIFTRTYVNQMRFDGPLGFNWDHNYNLRLRERREFTATGQLLNVVYRSTGALREDAYVQLLETEAGELAELTNFADAVFQGPAGYFDRLEKISDRYVLHSVNGIRINYGEHLFAESIVDRNGNTVRLDYEDLLLVRVTDPLGKRLRFKYDVRGRIVSVIDDTGGREARYCYNDQGDLEEVDLLFGESPGQNFSVIGHDYRYAGPSALSGTTHNLIEVIGPTGESVLENRYGDEPGLPDFNRVVYQRSEDGEFFYEYGRLENEAIDAAVDATIDPISRPIAVTRIQYPNGHQVEHYFNAQGNTVRRQERIISGAGGFETLSASYRYNVDGLMIEQTRPDGLRVEWRYGRETFEAQQSLVPNSGTLIGLQPADSQRFGNLQKMIQYPRPGLGEQRRIVIDMSYDAENLPASQTGPYYADSLLRPLQDQPIPRVYYEHDKRGNLICTRFDDVRQADGSRRTVDPLHVVFNALGLPIETRQGEHRNTVRYFDDLIRSAYVREMVVDPEGARHRTEFEVDTLGRNLRVRGPLGAVTEFAYTGFDAPRQVRVFIEGSGKDSITHIQYNKYRYPIESRERLWLEDGSAHPQNERVSRFDYDRYGRRVASSGGSAQQPELRCTRTVFASNGLPTSQIDALGNETRLSYDQRLLLSSATVAYGTALATTEYFFYGRAGELIRQINALGRVTRYEYDAFGRMHRTISAEGSVQERYFNAAGQVIRTRMLAPYPATGVNSESGDSSPIIRWREASFRHDEHGKLIERVDFLFEPLSDQNEEQLLTRFFYDSRGNLDHSVDALGTITRYRYDALNRLVSVTDALGNTSTVNYDESGRRILQQQQQAGVRADGTRTELVTGSQFELDALGRMVARVDALGNRMNYGYDSRGLCTRMTLPDGRSINTQFDVFGQVTQTQSGDASLPSAVHYAYDVAGRLLVSTLPSGAQIQQLLDVHGRVNRVERDDQTRAQFEFDALGRVLKHIDENGILARMHYSPDGQLLKVQHDASGFLPPLERPGYRPQTLPDSEYQYLPTGEIASVRCGDSVSEYRYDSLGRVLLEQCGLERTLFRYDRLGRIATIRYPSGRVLAYQHSPVGTIQRIEQLARGDDYPGDASLPEARRLVDIHSAGMQPLSFEFEQGLLQEITYDNNLRVIGQDWTRVDGATPMLSERLLRGPRGEVTVQQLKHGAEHAVQTRLFTHDELGRVVQSQDVDGIGLIETGPIATGRPDSQAIQSQWTSAIQGTVSAATSARSTAYELDINANRIRVIEQVRGLTVNDTEYQVDQQDRYQKIGAREQIHDRAGNLLHDGVHDFRYDSSNRLIEINSSEALVTIARDASGRISRLGSGAVEHQLVYAGLRPIEWRSSTGEHHQFVPLLRAHQFASIATAGLEMLPIGDSMDSILTWLVNDGSRGALRQYDPFGQVLSQTGTWPVAFGYGGFLEDIVFPVQHLLARSYDSASGRFLQRDPIGFGDGFNPYAFARHAPLTLTDYFGFNTAEVNWGDVAWIGGVGLGTSLLGAGAIAMLGGLAAMGAALAAPALAITAGVAAISLLAYGLYSGFSSGYAKARAAGVGIPGAMVVGGANIVLPVADMVEAATGYHFATTNPLSAEERNAAIGNAGGGLLGSLLMSGLGRAIFGRRGSPAGAEVPAAPALAAPRELIKAPPLRETPKPGKVLVADPALEPVGSHRTYVPFLQMAALHLENKLAIYSEVPDFRYGMAKGADEMALTLHGGIANGNRAATGLVASPMLTQRLGLTPNLPDGGTLLNAELAALLTVHYLKFTGHSIDLNSCGTGLFSSELGGVFAIQYATQLAKLLNKPITIKAPRGLLFPNIESVIGNPDGAIPFVTPMAGWEALSSFTEFLVKKIYPR